MFHPLCGYSLQKAAKVIAIADVVICCLYVLSHFIGGGYIYEKQYEQYENELLEVISRNDTGSTNQTSSKFNLSWEEYHKLIVENLPSIDIMIVLGLCAVVVAMLHVCMEIWLCRLLLKGAAHKDGSACKIWFWCRLGVTILFSIYSLVGILTVRTDLLDWLCELVNVYRMYTLLIIFEFKKEVSASVSMVKPR